MPIESQYNLQNEVTLYLSYGVRADFTHSRGTKSYKIIFMKDYLPFITGGKITVYSQPHGTVLKEFVIGPQSASNTFIWNIADTDFQSDKPLNYWVEAVDQDLNQLFYGTFTLQ